MHDAGRLNKIGNSGLKIIEGRHQPGPRFEVRTFVPEVIDEHRYLFLKKDEDKVFYVFSFLL